MLDTHISEIETGTRPLLLELPGDLVRLLRADRAHSAGHRGQNVHVVLVDSGFFFDHRWFEPYRDQLETVGLFGDGDPRVDEFGHGTATAAAFLSVAPAARLTGVRCWDPLAALQKALELKPDVIALPFQAARLIDLPTAQDDPAIRAFEALVAEAVSNNCLLVAAAGTRNSSALASHPDVVSVGGVFVDGDRMEPQHAISHFASRRYPVTVDSYVPDVCGPCGPAPERAHFRVPAPPEVLGEPRESGDITLASGAPEAPDALFRSVWGGSGVATACAAGVAALVRSKHPGLSPAEVRRRLRTSCRFVDSGLPPVFPDHDPPHDLVAGFGFLDAAAAVAA